VRPGHDEHFSSIGTNGEEERRERKRKNWKKLWKKIGKKSYWGISEYCGVTEN
jgi:hypothetical protein